MWTDGERDRHVGANRRLSRTRLKMNVITNWKITKTVRLNECLPNDGFVAHFLPFDAVPPSAKLQHRKQKGLLIMQGCQLRDVLVGPSRTRPITDPGHACSPVSRDATRNASFPLRSCERLVAWESKWMVFISTAP